MSALTYASVDRLLKDLGLVQDAAGFHGTLCGRLCLEAARGQSGASDQPLLEQLRDESLHSFHDIEAGFQPLLPEDGAALGDRVAALAQWCSGFVYGLGSVGGLDLRSMSEDAREMVSDMTEISRANLTPQGTSEGDEQAYAEILEYVRVGAQLVFLESREARQDAPPTLH